MEKREIKDWKDIGMGLGNLAGASGAVGGLAFGAGGLVALSTVAPILAVGAIAGVAAIPMSYPDKTSDLLKRVSKKLLSRAVENKIKRDEERELELGNKEVLNKSEAEKLEQKKEVAKKIRSAAIKKRIEEEPSFDSEIMKMMKENNFRYAIFDEKKSGLFSGMSGDKLNPLFDLSIMSKNNKPLIHIGAFKNQTVMMTPECLNEPQAFKLAAEIAKRKGIENPLITPPKFENIKDKDKRNELQEKYVESTVAALIEAGYPPENIALNKEFSHLVIEKPKMTAQEFVRNELMIEEKTFKKKSGLGYGYDVAPVEGQKSIEEYEEENKPKQKRGGKYKRKM